MAFTTHCLTLTRTTSPKAPLRRLPPRQPGRRRQPPPDTLLPTCAARSTWPGAPAAARLTGRPGWGWRERTAATPFSTDTTTASETRQRSWSTAANSATAAASSLGADTNRRRPAPSTSTTVHKNRVANKWTAGGLSLSEFCLGLCFVTSRHLNWKQVLNHIISCHVFLYSEGSC